MSPMGYSKSPITSSTSAVSGSAVPTAVGPGSLHTTASVAHANNVNSGGMPITSLAAATSSYSCTNPYGLKTVDGNVVLNSNNVVGMNPLSVATNVPVGVAGGAVNVGNNNTLCSTSMLSANPNMAGAIVGGGGSGGVGVMCAGVSGVGSSNVVNMNVIPGEGPPTPTQELDLSGSSSIDPQQRKCK